MFSRRRADSGDGADLRKNLVTLSEPYKPASEAYRTLRTNLLYSAVDKPDQAIVITSSGPNEGKTTTCANLGVVLAQAGKKCVILDCDLRKPSIHSIFELRNIWGVVDVIVGQRDLPDVWQEPMEKLAVVTSGSIPPNPTEMLGSKGFAKLLAESRQTFDYVLIDAPPVELFADAAILTKQADGAVIVLDARSTRKASLRNSLRSLGTVDATVLGTVMNNVKLSESSYYYSYAYQADSDQ